MVGVIGRVGQMMGRVGASTAMGGGGATIPLDPSFFVLTPLTLGREANSEAAISGGRSIRKTTGAGTVSGVWDVSSLMEHGKSYRMVATLRAVVVATGALYVAGGQRFIIRLGNNAALDPNVSGGSVQSAFDATVFSGFVNITAPFVYDDSRPLLGILATTVPDGVRIEIAGVGIEEYIIPPSPWDDIPVASARTVSLYGATLPTNGTYATPFLIPVGASEVHLRLTYNGLKDGQIVATGGVIVQWSSINAVGFAQADVTVPYQAAFWRPGDDADLWVTLPINPAKAVAGNQFSISLRHQGLSGVYSDFLLRVDAAAEAVALPSSLPFHRKQRFLDVSGATPLVEADLESMSWSDTGYAGNASSGTPVWRSRLSHGYSQDGNGENGLYTNGDAWPADAMTPHALEVDSKARPFLRLHSARFPAPVTYNGKTYPFQAAVLTGQRMPEWCHKTGLYRAQIVSPSQLGAWSAFWSIGKRVSSGANIWPPEIDFFEHFNGAFGAGYTKYFTSSAQHVGVHGSNARQRVHGFGIDLDRIGFPSDYDAWTQIHDYACLIEDDWVTHFVDGVEVQQHRNMTRSSDGNTDWALYPVINVAVKAPTDDPYNNGSTDMLVYGIQYFEASADFTVTTYNETAPYPNGQVLPAPDLTHDIAASFSGSGSMSIAFADAVFQDNFDRADGALEMIGSWTRANGATGKLSVSGNALAHGTSTLDTLYFAPDFGFTNHFVEITVKNNVVVSGQILCRAVDSNNWIGFRTNGGTLQCYKRVSGSLTLLGSGAIAINDVIRMEVSGTTITVKKNGSNLFTPVTVTDHATATKTGLIALGNNAANPWIDNFRTGPL